MLDEMKRIKLLEEHGNLSRQATELEEEWLNTLEEIEAINQQGV